MPRTATRWAVLASTIASGIAGVQAQCPAAGNGLNGFLLKAYSTNTDLGYVSLGTWADANAAFVLRPSTFDAVAAYLTGNVLSTFVDNQGDGTANELTPGTYNFGYRYDANGPKIDFQQDGTYYVSAATASNTGSTQYAVTLDSNCGLSFTDATGNAENLYSCAGVLINSPISPVATCIQVSLKAVLPPTTTPTCAAASSTFSLQDPVSLNSAFVALSSDEDAYYNRIDKRLSTRGLVLESFYISYLYSTAGTGQAAPFVYVNGNIQFYDGPGERYLQAYYNENGDAAYKGIELLDTDSANNAYGFDYTGSNVNIAVRGDCSVRATFEARPLRILVTEAGYEGYFMLGLDEYLANYYKNSYVPTISNLNIVPYQSCALASGKFGIAVANQSSPSTLSYVVTGGSQSNFVAYSSNITNATSFTYNGATQMIMNGNADFFEQNPDESYIVSSSGPPAFGGGYPLYSFVDSLCYMNFTSGILFEESFDQELAYESTSPPMAPFAYPTVYDCAGLLGLSLSDKPECTAVTLSLVSLPIVPPPSNTTSTSTASSTTSSAVSSTGNSTSTTTSMSSSSSTVISTTSSSSSNSTSSTASSSGTSSVTGSTSVSTTSSGTSSVTGSASSSTASSTTGSSSSSKSSSAATSGSSATSASSSSTSSSTGASSATSSSASTSSGSISPSSTPPTTNNAALADVVSLGCIAAAPNSTFMGFTQAETSANMTEGRCATDCAAYNFFALYSGSCYCANAPSGFVSVDPSLCSISCPGDTTNSTKCGGNVVKRQAASNYLSLFEHTAIAAANGANGGVIINNYGGVEYVNITITTSYYELCGCAAVSTLTTTTLTTSVTVGCTTTPTIPMTTTVTVCPVCVGGVATLTVPVAQATSGATSGSNGNSGSSNSGSSNSASSGSATVVVCNSGACTTSISSSSGSSNGISSGSSNGVSNGVTNGSSSGSSNNAAGPIASVSGALAGATSYISTTLVVAGASSTATATAGPGSPVVTTYHGAGAKIGVEAVAGLVVGAALLAAF